MTVPPPPPSPDDDGPTAFPPPTSAPGVPASSGTPPPPPPGAPTAPTAPAAPAAATARPPRPQVRGAAILVIAGALVAGIGVFLPWLSGGGETFNGTDTFITGRSFADIEIIEAPGNAMLFFAVVLLGLGIALYFAGRVLAVAILAIVGAATAVIMGFAMVTIVNDSRDFIGTDTVNFGVGAILQPLAAGLSLAGSIWATARRRR